MSLFSQASSSSVDGISLAQNTMTRITNLGSLSQKIKTFCSLFLKEKKSCFILVSKADTNHVNIFLKKIRWQNGSKMRIRKCKTKNRINIFKKCLLLLTLKNYYDSHLSQTFGIIQYMVVKFGSIPFT